MILGASLLMPKKYSLSLLCFLFLAFVGCNKTAKTQLSANSQANASPTNQTSSQATFDVCGLLTKEEIEATQGSPVKDTKGSEHSDAGLRVSQCFYTTDPFNKSVVLTVTQSDPASATKRSPKDFWKETFGRFEGEAKSGEGDKEKKESLREQEKKEKSTPPKKIEGIGDEAYWNANRVGGALYVLRNDAIVRVSVGGPDNEEGKLKKSKELAQKALQRL